MFYLYLFVFLLSFVIAPQVKAEEQSVPYNVSIKGVSDKELEQALRYSSDAVLLTKKPPASVALLNLRVKSDTRRFRQLLDSRGYYAATVQATIDEKNTPAKVIFAIQLGHPFVFSTLSITSTPPLAQAYFPSAEKLGLTAGTKAEAHKVVEAREKLLRYLHEQGYPFATVSEPSAVADHKTYSMAVSFTTSLGTLAHFGTTTLVGLNKVDPHFIEAKIPWKQGELYTPILIEKYEKTLNESGLFSMATVTIAPKTGENGQLPVSVTFKERPEHTVKAGVNYQTDEGPGVKLLWQHRNFFHHGEQVDISGSASAVKRTLDNSFTRSDFLQHDQSLKLFYTLDNEDTEAYFTNNVSVGTVVERKITPSLTAGVGTNYKLSHIKQMTESGDFGLISFPLYANFDSRDNPLDATKGHNSSLQFTPSLNTLAGNASFTKEYASATYYFSRPSLPKLVWANRAALGFIQSPSISNLPPNERFYAGGSGSVRGYGYQSLGPTENGAPKGGLSLFEMSSEIRYKISPTIGLVSFIDGGNSFTTAVPDIRKELHFGAGAGIRYYTVIAPIRFDIATPLNPPDGTGKTLQFYISLGQAF